MAEALPGLELVGFSVWERRTGTGRNVVMPARSYSINGEHPSFALLRPISEKAATDAVRDLILTAYAAWEAAQTTTATTALGGVAQRGQQPQNRRTLRGSDHRSRGGHLGSDAAGSTNGHWRDADWFFCRDGK
jgi:hypothetical protein